MCYVEIIRKNISWIWLNKDRTRDEDGYKRQLFDHIFYSELGRIAVFTVFIIPCDLTIGSVLR